jgi:hypothetical protein
MVGRHVDGWMECLNEDLKFHIDEHKCDNPCTYGSIVSVSY